MGQALYRKYRSKRLGDVIGQEHVTDTLNKAIKSGRINHAYLFTGPRGVGKTTVARILAHEVNNLPYVSDAVHLDIIEIDAASNRRIDEVRDLREKVHISPSSAKYKVYIIDEVHMLTREAFNALLKTLEEPPTHCIFILATTEAHRLPETIVSRTQRFAFKPIVSTDAKKHLGMIAGKEKIAIEPGALDLLAQFGQGSFRDSISLLDQLATLGKKITEKTVADFLGIPPDSLVNKILDGVRGSDSSLVLSSLEELRTQGIDSVLTAQSISGALRNQIINGDVDRRWTKLLKSLLEVSSSEQPFELLEISLLEASSNSSQSRPLKIVSSENYPKLAEKEVKKNYKPKEGSNANKPGSDAEFNLDNWDHLLEIIKTKAASLYTALRLARPSQENEKLTLSFRFPLHKKKVESSENMRLIGDAIFDLTGFKGKIVCVVEETKPKLKTKVATLDQHEVANISNIFGSAEVLESLDS